jgi:8-oxo-dGTP pyrophosphatase MutT (NUDIX family)
MPRRRQYAALPYVVVGDRVLVLLVTSRDTGRWVVPKGWPKRKRTPAELAALEAFEEAGIEGEVSKRPIGSFTYGKRLRGMLSVRCKVDVFALRVTAEHLDWPERSERTRCWMRPEAAAEGVDEAELGELIREFGRTRLTDAAGR